MALDESAAGCPADGDLDRRMIRLRWWAVWFLNRLGDSAAQAILIGERLLADQERVLGPDHPDTLTSRNNLAIAYQDAGRTGEAITLHEQNLADPRTRPGPRPPRHPELAQQPRRRLPGRRAAPTRRSPCTSRPWPTGNASWAPTTPTP